MSYSEMLHNFLENDLPGSNEETLFHALARDEDLRFEMKYLLSLKAAVAEDEEAAVIPLATTSTLFGRLGYTLPAAAATAGSAATRGGLFGKWTGHLLSGLLGVILASTFFLVGSDGSGNRGGGDGSSGTTIAATTTTAGTALADGGVEAKEESRENARERSAREATTPSTSETSRIAANNGAAESRTSSRERSITRSSTRARSAQGGNRSLPTAPNAPASSKQKTSTEPTGEEVTRETRSFLAASAKGSTEEIDLLPTRSAEELFRSNEAFTSRDPLMARDRTNSLAEDIRIKEQKDPNDLLPGRTKERGIALSVRGSHVPLELKESELPEAVQAIKQLEKEQQNVGPTDFAVGLNIPLPNAEAFSAIVEVGRESYLMTFRDTRADGSTTLVESDPEVLWATLGLRFSPLRNEAISPFAQVAIGGSGSGIMERLMLGTTWSPGGPIELTGGIEYSMTQYQFRGEFYSSPRLGLSYGVQWNLGE